MLLKLLIFGIVFYLVWYFFQKHKNTKVEGSNNRKEEADVKSKFCSQCGAPLGKDDRFCPVCGAKVSNAKELFSKKYPSKKAPGYSPSSGMKKGLL